MMASPGGTLLSGMGERMLNPSNRMTAPTARWVTAECATDSNHALFTASAVFGNHDRGQVYIGAAVRRHHPGVDHPQAPDPAHPTTAWASFGPLMR